MISAMRRFAALVVFVVFCAVHPVQALSLLDPVNIPGTLDGGVVKLAADLPYGNGARQKLDIYAPENSLENKAPVLIFLYGGAWKQGTKADYPFVGHAFAARGFVTVIPDYRLVPEVAYPEFLADNSAAVRWVQDNIARYGGDTNRVYLAGHSAGAYNAVMLGMDSAYLRDAGVTIPIRGVAGLAGPYAVYPFEFKELQDAFGNVDNPQMTQPINLPTDETAPLFLGHGSTDFIVKPENTTRMEEKFLAANRGVTAKVYEGLGHMEVVMALSNVWRWRSSVLDDMVAFFEQNGAFNADSLAPVDLVGVADGTVETAADAAEGVVTQ